MFHPDYGASRFHLHSSLDSEEGLTAHKASVIFSTPDRYSTGGFFYDAFAVIIPFNDDNFTINALKFGYCKDNIFGYS